MIEPSPPTTHSAMPGDVTSQLKWRVRAWATWGTVAAPGIIATVVAAALAIVRFVPIDPMSVWAMGIGASLASAQWVQRGQVWRRRVVGAWVVSAGAFVWAVANRVVAVPTGPFDPGDLLVVTDGLVAAAMVPDRGWVAARRWIVAAWAAYACRADLVNVWALVTVAVTMRLLIMFRAPVFVIGDSGEYLEAARQLLHDGRMDSLGTIHPPAYPLFLSICILILGPDYLGVALAQHTLGVCAIVLLYYTSRIYTNQICSFVVTAFYSVNGFLIILEHGIYTEALFTPILVFFLYATARSIRESSIFFCFLAGLIGGLSILTRLVAQPLVLVLLFLIVIINIKARKINLFAMPITFTFGIFITYSPWVSYNLITNKQTGLSSGIGVGALLPRMWEEDLQYFWTNPEHPDLRVRKTLQIFQENKDQNKSIGTLWRAVESEFNPPEAADLMFQASIDVLLRNRNLFVDRTWFRLKRIWRGGFAQETVNELYGEQTRLGFESPIFKIQDNGNKEIEPAGNLANRLTSIARIENIPNYFSIPLYFCNILVIFVSLSEMWLALPAIFSSVLLLASVMNADRARYRHPADPFLLLSFVIGALLLDRFIRIVIGFVRRN